MNNTNNEPKEVIIIVGMHRSGTSLLAGLIHKMGIELGNNLLKGDEFNPKGYFEDIKIYEFNRKLLARLHSSWTDINFLPKGWENKPNLADLEEELCEIFIAKHKINNRFGLKEPVVSILLPIYKKVLRKLDLPFKFIWIKRPHEPVYNSLNKRRSISRKAAYTLKEYYDTLISKNLVNERFLLIWYDELLSNPVLIIKTIQNFLKIDQIDIQANLAFISQELNRSSKFKVNHIKIKFYILFAKINIIRYWITSMMRREI